MRGQKRGSREMFVPLSHPPGHAQADFGEALVVIGGVERKAYFLAFDLPHSDACYIRAYPAANTEAWLDGHVHAFAFFGGVPWSILYDNDKCLVARIMPDGTRNRTQRFSAMLSHYVIDDRYGRPGKGNDKGKVEGLVGYGRRNFMAPPSHACKHALPGSGCRGLPTGMPLTTIWKPAFSIWLASREAKATEGDFPSDFCLRSACGAACRPDSTTKQADPTA